MSLALLDAAWTEGLLWPRWLMDSNNGLGAATFVTYPPVGYWAAALVKTLTGLPVASALALTVALWRCLALFTTWFWLRRHVAAGPALAAAALAALLPYPALFNPWIRFAYAEIAGAALLPLLLLATERAARGRGLAGLGLGFAALAMTHVPTCALAAHLLPLYALGYGGWRAAWRCLLGGALGAALAACFLLPAFGLMGASGASTLSNPTWQDMLMFWSPLGEVAHWRHFRLIVWGAGWATLLLGLAMAWRLRHAGGWRAGGLGRAALVLLLAAFGLMTVVSLPLWLLLPELTAMEFPWRASGLMVPAVAALAALAMDRARWPRPRLEPLLVVAAGAACAAAVPLFLWLNSALGAPEWPRFLPAEQRLAFTRSYSGAYSSEHTPGTAVAAGGARSPPGRRRRTPCRCRPPAPCGCRMASWCRRHPRPSACRNSTSRSGRPGMPPGRCRCGRRRTASSRCCWTGRRPGCASGSSPRGGNSSAGPSAWRRPPGCWSRGSPTGPVAPRGIGGSRHGCARPAPSTGRACPNGINGRPSLPRPSRPAGVPAMEDLQLVAFLLGVAIDTAAALLVPVALAATALVAAANVGFEPVAY